jgi:hypothetical protein
MRWFTTCALVCGLLLAPSMARAAIIINEFAYDDTGGDDREFVELHNNGGAAVDISGWVVRNSDTVAPPADNNADFTIPGAVNSGTTMLAAGGYYVIGQAGMLNLNLLATGTLENDNEAIQLLDGTSTVVDTVSYETNKGPVAVAQEGPGIFGNSGTQPDLPGNVTVSLGRFNGGDTNNNGRDFGMRPSTPGTANNTGLMEHYLPPDPTGSTVGTDVPGLTGTFVNARYINPTVADANNPNAIPAAPFTGDRAIVAWDPSGGGNAVTSQQVFDTTKMGFRIRAYLDTTDQPQQFNATPTNFLGSEVSIYSVGGGDMLTNLTDLAGNVGIAAGTLPASDTANGTTGIAWVYERTAISGSTPATQTLYLVDANDGGDSDSGGNTPLDWTIIQAIDISGMPSDWYDLSIKVDELGVGVASFNGTEYPFIASAGLAHGAFNIGYRENLQQGADGTPDSMMRPPTFTLVPEPGTLSLLVIGLVGLLVRRR